MSDKSFPQGQNKQQPKKSKKAISIRSTSLLIIGIQSLLALIVIGFFSYKFSIQNATIEAKSKGQIVLDYVHSSRQFLMTIQRPLIMEIVEEDRFYPELMSGAVVARETFNIFKTKLPEYQFKQASLDPLNLENKADSQEINIIKAFRYNAELKIQEGIITKNAKKYFYMAQPVKVAGQQCLQCHGDPSTAPKDQVELYGTENGYHWTLGDTVAAFIVYVPFKGAMDTAFKSAGMLILIGGTCMLLSLLFMWYYLNKRIVSPIMNLCKRAEEISMGQNFKKSIENNEQNEIGMLARAIERLRVSIEILIRRNRRV